MVGSTNYYFTELTYDAAESYPEDQVIRSPRLPSGVVRARAASRMLALPVFHALAASRMLAHQEANAANNRFTALACVEIG
jgi:hypothetical protein